MDIPNYGWSYYRSRDSISKFAIRVTLIKTGADSLLLPHYLKEQTESQDNDITQLTKKSRKTKRATNNEERSQVEEKPLSTFKSEIKSESHILKWQEKVFSKKEIKEYSGLGKTNTVLQEKYKEDIQNLNLKDEQIKSGNRVFTYVDHDRFEDVLHVTNSESSNTQPEISHTKLSELVNSIRNRKALAKRPLTSDNIVSDSPSLELKKQNRLINDSSTIMYIMADLSSDQNSLEEKEVILCCIKYFDKNILAIKPDFNENKALYTILGNTNEKELYQYRLEHSSQQLSKEEQDRENKIYKEISIRQSDYLKSLVGSQFTEKDGMRLIINAEILIAQNFEYRDLYVHWFLDLPEDWSTDNKDGLYGLTHTCKAMKEGKNYVAHFSMPISFDLIYNPPQDIQNLLSDESLTCSNWPRLYFEVDSTDSWQRFRLEGYGYLTLPSRPGSRQNIVNCWRSLGSSFIDQLRRYFVGSSPELDDILNVAIPENHKSRNLSKFGLKTMSTGQILIQTHSIFQSKVFGKNVRGKQKSSSVFERFGFNSKLNSLIEVLEAFQNAKKRMIEARKNLIKAENGNNHSENQKNYSIANKQ